MSVRVKALSPPHPLVLDWDVFVEAFWVAVDDLAGGNISSVSRTDLVEHPRLRSERGRLPGDGG